MDSMVALMGNGSVFLEILILWVNSVGRTLEFVLPIFQKASAARINFAKKIPEKRLKQFCSERISLEPETWIFKWTDSDKPIEGTANT